MLDEEQVNGTNTSREEENYFEREQITPKMWSKYEGQEPMSILHPDDPLMKRFQDALKSHLTRMNDKLSEEIYEMKTTVKSLIKVGEGQSRRVEDIRIETANQKKAIENYQTMLSDMTNMRECFQIKIESIKESRKKCAEELNAEKRKEAIAAKEVHELRNQVKKFADLEKDISEDISISKRMSEKDQVLQREITREKKQQDLVLYKLTEENWALDSEKKYLREQVLLKDKEKDEINRAIADANAELEVVQRERKSLMGKWNEVLVDIKHRDEISNELNTECREMQHSFKNLQFQLSKIKKETMNEMENNERLMSIRMKVDEDFAWTMKNCNSGKKKLECSENELAKLMKISEQCREENKIASNEFHSVENEENLLRKEEEKLAKCRAELEDEMMKRTSESVIHDKTVRYLNKLLQEAKAANKEQDFALAQVERAYRANLLQVERLISIIENDKSDLGEIVRKNVEKEKNVETIRGKIKQWEANIAIKQRDIFLLNKKIHEILQTTGGEETNLQDLKINTLEDQIEDLNTKSRTLRQSWLRQECNLNSVSEQRTSQLQELGLLAKQIMIMEQKNHKLGYELEKQKKEEINVKRKIDKLQQSLLQKNSQFASRKELKDHLEDEYFLTKNDYVLSLKEAEIELMQFQGEIQELEQQKIALKEKIDNVQWETLSWEKKVKLAGETSKTIKEERKAGGDVAIMKSEIHKMEIRLSHLKKIQEKLMQDMEFCISRRENILEKANAEEKRNPRAQQNQRIGLQKRLDEQRSRIRQIEKETRQVNEEMAVLEKQQIELLEKLDEEQLKLREIEDLIPDIDKQIMEIELIKSHNLEILIRKQRKVQMLQNVKSGRYKMSCKSETTLNDETYKQKMTNAQLKEIMDQTRKDFPLLKNEIRKILLSLET